MVRLKVNLLASNLACVFKSEFLNSFYFMATIIPQDYYYYLYKIVRLFWNLAKLFVSIIPWSSKVHRLIACLAEKQCRLSSYLLIPTFLVGCFWESKEEYLASVLCLQLFFWDRISRKDHNYFLNSRDYLQIKIPEQILFQLSFIFFYGFQGIKSL